MFTQVKEIAQKEYKTQYNWEGKVIHWELYKRLTFDHTTKWYKYKPESVLKNEIHKILWDYEVKTDHNPSQKTEYSGI